MDQFETLTGWRLTSVVPEATGLPLTQFGVALGIAQYTDGQQPNPTAVFDNLEVQTSEIPSIGIQPGVRLTWPDVGSYAVECAPTVNGPWLPVQNTIPPGCQQMTVPQSGPMQFFRLVQAP